MLRPCHACGALLPPEARFCPRCGAAVAAGEATQERKLVTVLFADLVDSTGLSRRLDPERAREVLHRFFEVAALEIGAMRGQLEKFIGDAVMAVFGLPRVGEDDAVRAVRAGLATADRVARLGRELGLEHPLQVRVGIETGEAAAGESPAGQMLVTGPVVNAAARLQAAARPGEVLIGATTRTMVLGAARLGAARAVRARGFDGTLAAHPVLGLERRSVRRTIPLVGRRGELALLRACMDRAGRLARPHLVTVLGDAGIGKSRLVDELCALLPDGTPILVGRGEVHGGATLLGPLGDMLRRFAGVDESDDPERVLERLASAIGATGVIEDPAALAVRLGVALGLPGPVPRDEMAMVQDAQRAFSTLATALATRPLVLVLDDAHVARGAVLDLAERLASRTRHAPLRLLVVVSARPELLEERPSWGSTAWNHLLIRLEPLAADESGDLARQAGGRRITDDTARRVAAWAGGNPFFIVETTGMLLDEPTADLAHAPLPPTVQAVVAARLDRLPAPMRELARAASVFLDSFDLEELAMVREPDHDALAGLVEAEILTVEEKPRRWRFRHQILREVAYAGLAKRERLRLHLAVADGLEAAGLPGVADHLENAAHASLDLDPGDRSVADRAADALVLAGERARRRMESRRAVDRYRRALALAGPREAWGVREGRALAGIGEARYWLADFTLASEALTEAERLGTETGDAATLTTALRFLGDIVLNVDADIERAEELFQRSLEAAERLGDPRAIARSLLFAGWAPWSRERYDDAEATWRRALEVSRSVNDRWVEARALIGISVAGCERDDDLEAAAAAAEEGLRVARDLCDPFSTAVAMVQLGRTVQWRGRPEEALPLFDEAAGSFEELGARWELADALYARGSAYADLDRLEDAESDLRQAVRLCEELDARALGGWAERALARVRARREAEAAAAVPGGDEPARGG